MDRFDFIDRIIALYPHAIKDREVQYDIYKRALTAKNIDFEKLMDRYSSEYKDSFPPPAAWLKEQSLKCLKPETVPRPQTFKTITAVDVNGVYGFAGPGDSINPSALSKRFLLWWYGGFYECPRESKGTLESILQKQREKVFSGTVKG